MNQAEARALLLQLLPPGIERWVDLRPGPDPANPAVGASDPWLIVDAAAEGLRTKVFDQLDQVAADADPMVMGAVGAADWELALALDRTRAALGGSLTARQAQVRSLLAEGGLPTDAAILAALFPLTGGSAATLIHHSRAAVTAQNTYSPAGTTAILASDTSSIFVIVGDNAPAGRMGPQLFLTLTHPQAEDLQISLFGPAALEVASWPAGTLKGSYSGKSVGLAATSLAHRPIDGQWTVAITNTGTHTGSFSVSLFVEGIGRAPNGADGRGGLVFEWSVAIDENTVPAARYTREAALASVGRWNLAHTNGGVALYQTDGSLSALGDDDNCIGDLCVGD